jgi:hypothetical protein
MESKQTESIARIRFLQKFTEELVINSSENPERARKIKVEKLKQKLIKPTLSPEEAFKRIVQEPAKDKTVPLRVIKPPFQRREVPKRTLILGQKRRYSKPLPENQRIPPRFKQDEIQRKFPESPLNKLEPLLRDNSIQTIECSGPGRNLLVKRYNKMNITKITLSEEEIRKIINDFSIKTKIPLVGGILRAATENLLVSAVVSEFAGSRFVINKATPYSLISK